jgi:hypothetical protein
MSNSNLSVQRSLHDVVRACRQGSTAMCHGEITLHAKRICALSNAKRDHDATSTARGWYPELTRAGMSLSFSNMNLIWAWVCDDDDW